jgi:hypothetical protein
LSTSTSGRAVGIAEQLGDDGRGSLAAGLGESLEALCVLALDAHEDDELRLGVALVTLYVAGVELRQVGIESPGLGSGLVQGLVLIAFPRGFYARPPRSR